MSFNKTWNDIPTLHLELDTDYEKRLKSKQARRHDRADAASLKSILPQKLSRLQIRVGTADKGILDGLILDLSVSGARVRIPKALHKREAVKIGFILNQRTIMAKAITRWIEEKENFCDVGLEFVGLPPADAELIAQLASASIMSRVGKVK